MSGEGTDFLYPFIEGDEHDAPSLLADLAESARAKAADSDLVTATVVAENRTELDCAARAMAERLDRGGTLFTFGNGGSSTDAATIAALFTRPPSGRPFAARSLAADQAIITSLANDVGYELIFSRQLIAHATGEDVALGISTSGDSENLLRAFAEARLRGILTIGFAGYEGGAMAASDDIDHCIVVRSHSVHRVQEAQARLGFELWSRMQQWLAAGVA